MTRLIAGCLLAILLLFLDNSLLAQTADDSASVNEEVVEAPPAVEDSEDGNEEKQESRFIPVKEREKLDVNERGLRNGYTDDLKKDKDYWYADATVKKKKEKGKTATGAKEELKYDPDYTPFMKRAWVQTLLWIIIVGGFVFAVMWYLVDSNVGLFRKKKVVTATDETGMEEMPEDIFAINYQREIEKALAQGNYRLAVRIQFLRTLKILADKQIIHYKQDKTNLDYLMEISPKSYYPIFFRLTRHFEYSWYGHFEVGEHAYQLIAGEFNQFEKQLPH